MLTLIVGGARSGKSRAAQTLCAKGAKVAYVATARIEDEEMRARIARHRGSRPSEWLSVEEPLAIADAVRFHAPRMDFILLDCLTIWLSNFCGERRYLTSGELESAAAAEVARVIAAAESTHLVVVSNEVGSGIVPETPLGRVFRDLQGLVNQQVACQADFVYLTVAGIPLRIKPAGEGA